MHEQAVTAGQGTKWNVLVHTDVWLDFVTDRRGTASAIAQVFDRVEVAGGALLTSVVSMYELFYALQAYLCAGGDPDKGAESREQVAWATLRMLRERSTIVGADLGDCFEAEYLRQLHGDFGDDLVMAAAKRGRADILLTGDADLRRHAPMAALGIDEMCAYVGVEVRQ